ncbi:site-specific integrase [Dyadobacter frigoris]|uniref:Integrase n=1 Tax=Dyadobacter frigoris TaxID=2576211 RepID=A0A4U6CPC3_9BACT|nr:site-specific integrase [Dyadobacter frigoris]TKT85976.1 integrase [Dyadobacter frigoris]
MKEKLKIHEVMDRVLAGLKQERYSDYTIGRYRHCYNGVQKFIQGKNVTYYSNTLAVDYVQHQFGIVIDGFYHQYRSNVAASIRALRTLSDYSEHGILIKKRGSGKKPFECPDVFSKDYESFKLACKSRSYAPMGEASLFWSLHRFLIFMKQEGLTDSREMRSIHILKFLTSQKDYSSRHIATTISRLRNYLRFLYQEGIIEHDLCKCLPHMKITRNPFIPSVWQQTDVKKLLGSIDRQNPKGKRDYAILLLVTRLGLRVGDIRTLKLSDLNWNRNLISIIMQKTRQQLQLPLLDDVGWAIIDYLRNGRPQTDSNFVFIRHKAPYNGFADHNCLHKMLVRHMVSAKIETMNDQKHGLHSLRSTLALTLLENGTPLPIISEVLGHQSVQTTRFYLKIDMNGLRNCVINPEEGGVL